MRGMRGSRCPASDLVTVISEQVPGSDKTSRASEVGQWLWQKERSYRWRYFTCTGRTWRDWISNLMPSQSKRMSKYDWETEQWGTGFDKVQTRSGQELPAVDTWNMMAQFRKLNNQRKSETQTISTWLKDRDRSRGDWWNSCREFCLRNGRNDFKWIIAVWAPLSKY